MDYFPERSDSACCPCATSTLCIALLINFLSLVHQRSSNEEFTKWGSEYYWVLRCLIRSCIWIEIQQYCTSSEVQRVDTISWRILWISWKSTGELALHTQVMNLFSILHSLQIWIERPFVWHYFSFRVGLQNKFGKKESLFGEGIYLALDPR